MAAFTCLAQQVNSTPGNHFTAVLDKRLQQFLQVHQFRLAVDQRHHVDAEHVLQLGLAVQVVQHHLTGLATLELDHHPQAILVGFVAQFGNALDFLFLDQLGNTLDQARLVQLVRNLGNDDGFTAGFLVPLNLGTRPHINASTAGTVGLHNAGTAVDNRRGREIRARNVFHQAVNINIRVVQQGQAGADDFTEVMRRDIGSHADSNTG